MKLSICLITYNRSTYLRKTLTEFFTAADFSFDYEVLVCDNCSTDETSEVVAELMRDHPQLRYVRQTRNVGPEANLVAAFHMAEGEYVVYLADDDQLVPEAVARVLAYMDEHPDVGVCQCPWELWDDVEKQGRGLFYRLDAPRQFAREDSLNLCDFILKNHIFPEIGIYRAEVMRKMFYLPRTSYWAFVHVINVLEHAKVAFLPIPYYRSITVHWPGEHRKQTGHEQAATSWDLYRGGLEAMIHRAFLLKGIPGVLNEHAAAINQAVQHFVNMRLKVALRLLLGKRDFIGAHDVLVRLVAAKAIAAEEVSKLRTFIMGRAALQVLIETFDSATTLEQIGLYKVEAGATVAALLHEMRPELPIKEIDDLTLEASDRSRTLVLTGRHESRKELLHSGYKPGFVAVEQDLLRMFAV